MRQCKQLFWQLRLFLFTFRTVYFDFNSKNSAKTALWQFFMILYQLYPLAIVFWRGFRKAGARCLFRILSLVDAQCTVCINMGSNSFMKLLNVKLFWLLNQIHVHLIRVSSCSHFMFDVSDAYKSLLSLTGVTVTLEEAYRYSCLYEGRSKSSSGCDWYLWPPQKNVCKISRKRSSWLWLWLRFEVGTVAVAMAVPVVACRYIPYDPKTLVFIHNLKPWPRWAFRRMKANDRRQLFGMLIIDQRVSY